MMHRASDNGWDSLGKEVWDEPEAVRLLQEAGALVVKFETTGARMSQRELYHARLIAAHDAQDMAAYRIALNGYVEAAREAYRKARSGRGKA